MGRALGLHPVSLPPSPEEWRALIGRGYPVYQATMGHLVVLGQETQVQAACTCGWRAPDRTGDPHQTLLVVDDLAQHCHTLRVQCPDWSRECSECPRQPQVRVPGPGDDMWWQQRRGPRLG